MYKEAREIATERGKREPWDGRDACWSGRMNFVEIGGS